MQIKSFTATSDDEAKAVASVALEAENVLSFETLHHVDSHVVTYFSPNDGRQYFTVVIIAIVSE
jgi:hypothetical protein